MAKSEKNQPDFQFSFNSDNVPVPQIVEGFDKSNTSIDLDNLSQYDTSQITKEILAKKDLGLIFSVLWQMLLKENQQYRQGYSPRIETKILNIISIDTAYARDFLNRIIRSKESAYNLKRIVKLSEIYELLKEIDEWFSEKQKIIEETKEITVAANDLQELIELSAAVLLNQPEKAEKYKQSIKNLSEIAKRKSSTEHSLVSEIVDLHYNLLHLIILDPKGEEIYQYWINEINQCLGWDFYQAASLVVAKYHPRIFKSEGNNNKQEYVEIANLVNDTNPNNQDEEKMDFPSNERLKNLVQILDRIRLEKPADGYPYEITLKMRLEYLHKKFKVENSRFRLYAKVMLPLMGLSEKQKNKKITNN